jgi:hypothetical protein
LFTKMAIIAQKMPKGQFRCPPKLVTLPSQLA